MILCILSIFILTLVHNVFTVTTNLSSSSVHNNYNSIVTLSSDSEDELPSLSQRIGLTKTAAGSSKDCPVNGGIVEQAMDRGEKKQRDDRGPPLLTTKCRIISDEIPSASCLTRTATMSRISGHNSATAVMATAHNGTISMPTGPTYGDLIVGTSNIITIDDYDSSTSYSQKSQDSPVSSSLTNQ